MNRTLGIVLTLLLLGSSVGIVASPTAPTFTIPSCLQDQYGNQYQNLVQDYVHNIITSSAVSNQQCTTSQLSMVGSWVVDKGGKTIVELTVANDGTVNNCVPIYKLKGVYPSSQWYYVQGFSTNQQFTYAACSADSPVLPDMGVGGMHGAKKD